MVELSVCALKESFFLFFYLIFCVQISKKVDVYHLLWNNVWYLFDNRSWTDKDGALGVSMLKNPDNFRVARAAGNLMRDKNDSDHLPPDFLILTWRREGRKMKNPKIRAMGSLLIL